MLNYELMKEVVGKVVKDKKFQEIEREMEKTEKANERYNKYSNIAYRGGVVGGALVTTYGLGQWMANAEGKNFAIGAGGVGVFVGSAIVDNLIDRHLAKKTSKIKDQQDRILAENYMKAEIKNECLAEGLSEVEADKKVSQFAQVDFDERIVGFNKDLAEYSEKNEKPFDYRDFITDQVRFELDNPGNVQDSNDVQNSDDDIFDGKGYYMNDTYIEM